MSSFAGESPPIGQGSLPRRLSPLSEALYRTQGELSLLLRPKLFCGKRIVLNARSILDLGLSSCGSVAGFATSFGNRYFHASGFSSLPLNIDEPRF